jgi:hypothetical protein
MSICKIALAHVLINLHLQDGETCLAVACRAEQLDVVKYLIEVGGTELLMLLGRVSLSSIEDNISHKWIDMHDAFVPL